MESEDWFIVGVIAFVIALLGLAVWACNKDAKEWAAFSKAHACKLVGVTDGHVSTGFAGGKVVTTYTSGQNGYLCNDGVTYWKDR